MTHLPDTSRAHNPTNLSASRAPEADFGQILPEEDGAVILACCVASLVFALLAVFGTGSWPLIEAWVWRVVG